MPFLKDADYVFLVVTWDEEDGMDTIEQRELFGPYVAHPDGSHLDEIEERLLEWKAQHPDRENAAAHLFRTHTDRPAPNGR